MSDTNRSGVLSEMTRDDVKKLNPEVVLFGMASTEPHGPHLPYGTDVHQTEGVCRREVTQANDRAANALMYPTLPIGNNVNFKAYPFTRRIGVRTLMHVVPTAGGTSRKRGEPSAKSVSPTSPGTPTAPL